MKTNRTVGKNYLLKLTGVTVILLLFILSGCTSKSVPFIEPPFTEKGLIDYSNYTIPIHEVDQEVIDELKVYIKDLNDAQMRLNEKVIQLKKEGRFPDMPSGQFMRIDKAVVVACFPGGWTWL